MAKKSKDEFPNPDSVSNRDVLQRLNFLYQASALLGTVQTPPKAFQEAIPKGLTGQERKEEKRRRNKARHSTACVDLSRAYVKSMKVIGQKTNTRLDPAVKRTLCKGCNLVLVPGVSELVRINTSSSHGHTVSYTCMSCKTTRRIPAPPILDEDASSETTEQAQPDPSNTVQHPAEDTTTAMDVDMAVPSAAEFSKAVERRKRSKGPRPRLPPLFERKGHVVFRGSERIS